jgi:DNA-binding MarR family transcriptional regulator
MVLKCLCAYSIYNTQYFSNVNDCDRVCYTDEMLAPEPPTGSEHSVGMALVALGRGVMRICTDALEPSGLKPRHLKALNALRDGPLTQQSLGEAVRTDPTQLVALLNELETAELVSRRRDLNDRRRHIVELSEAGANRLANAEQLVADAEERLLAGLSATDRSSFTRILATVIANTGVSVACNSVTDTTDDLESETA